MTGPPLVVLSDSEYAELFKHCESGAAELRGTGNCVAGGGPVTPPPAATCSAYGFAGPFLDSVYLSGSAELTNIGHELGHYALANRKKRYCWPLEDSISIWTRKVEPACLADLDSKPNCRWLVQAKFQDGHHALPIEYCGDGPMKGVRILASPPGADGRSQFKLFISPRVLFALRAIHENYHDVLCQVMDTVSTASYSDNTKVLKDYELTGTELHVTIDTWGYNFNLQSLERLVTVRRRFKGEARDGNKAVILEIDNNIPIFSKHYCDSQSLYLGTRGTDNRQTNIYDKILHAATNGSLTYLEPFWKGCGWNGTDKVWRIEVRHGQGYLRKHGLDIPKILKMGDINSPFNAIEISLFRTFLEQTKLIDPHTASRERRCALDPFWQYLTDHITPTFDCPFVWKPRTMKLHTDAVKLTQMAAGCAANLVALVQESACLRAVRSNKVIWSKESLQIYQQAKEHVLHELSALIDDKIAGRSPSAEDIAASINQMAEKAASAEYEPQEVA